METEARPEYCGKERRGEVYSLPVFPFPCMMVGQGVGGEGGEVDLNTNEGKGKAAKLTIHPTPPSTSCLARLLSFGF